MLFRKNNKNKRNEVGLSDIIQCSSHAKQAVFGMWRI